MMENDEASYGWHEMAKEALTKDQDMAQSPNPYTHIICVADALKWAYQQGCTDGQVRRVGTLDGLVSEYASTIEKLTGRHENTEAVRADAELGRLVRMMEIDGTLVRRYKSWIYSDRRGGSGDCASPEDALQLVGV